MRARSSVGAVSRMRTTTRATSPSAFTNSPVTERTRGSLISAGSSVRTFGFFFSSSVTSEASERTLPVSGTPAKYAPTAATAAMPFGVRKYPLVAEVRWTSRGVVPPIRVSTYSRPL